MKRSSKPNFRTIHPLVKKLVPISTTRLIMECWAYRRVTTNTAMKCVARLTMLRIGPRSSPDGGDGMCDLGITAASTRQT